MFLKNLDKFYFLGCSSRNLFSSCSRLRSFIWTRNDGVNAVDWSNQERSGCLPVIFFLNLHVAGLGELTRD